MIVDCSQAAPSGASGARNKHSKTSVVGSVDDMMTERSNNNNNNVET
jgi:hypothetical protein